MHIEIGIEEPNELSEELLKCLIGIFLELNQPSLDREELSDNVVPKLSLSCMKSSGFTCKAPSLFLSNVNASSLDPYGISSDLDCSARDIGPYKDFIQITSSTLDIERFSQCLPAFGKLRFIFCCCCCSSSFFAHHAS